MPICKICGKELKNPSDPRHIKSKYHQNALKKLKYQKKEEIIVQDKTDQLKLQNIMDVISDIKENILILENRISKIESIIDARLLTDDYNKKSHLLITELKDNELIEELVNIINQRKDYKQIKKSITLKELKNILKKKFNLNENQFRNIILKLYRKQLIDLQPGGPSTDYHLLSPTGKKFYYLILKS